MSPEVAELARLGLEQALNAALAADPASQQSLRGLIGKRVRIELVGLVQFDLLAQENALILADIGADMDTPDATLRASPLGFLRAKMRGDLMHGDLQLLGDSHIALRAARLLADFQPDIESLLAPRVGRLAARPLARAWQTMQQELHRLIARKKDSYADFLHDESELSPRQHDIEAWMDSVDQLQNRLHALESRVQTLETTP